MRRPEDLRRLAELLGVEPDFLSDCVLHGVLDAEDDDAARLSRVRRLKRLCDALELDVFAGSLVVELLERMEEMRRELDRLRPRG